MLLNIKCDAITSVHIHLEYDDRTRKDRFLEHGDIVDIDFAQNGLRRSIEGKIIKISCKGPEQKGWYILVDGSDNFINNTARIPIMSILDCEVIKRARDVVHIETVKGEGNIRALRIIDDKLEFTKDGHNWLSVKIDESNIIKPSESDEEEEKENNEETQEPI